MGAAASDLATAFNEWTWMLGDRVIMGDDRIQKEYGYSTLDRKSHNIPAALLPLNRAEVIDIVKVAHATSVSLYPISVGHNWGYGSSRPPKEGCVILDLSHLDKITSFDKELGLVTVEPGVTYRQLYQFLKKERAPFMAPVFGSGPYCSLIGNALDRGHSTTPPIDRFATLYGIEAVLPDGSLYRSSNGAASTEAFYKWGVGPYLDGLFVQSNLGIVVSATFKLAPQPARIEAFLGHIKAEADLGDCIDTLRSLHGRLGSLMPSIKLYNPQRMLFSMTPYPKKEEREHGIAPQPFIELALRENSFTHWTVVGALYGEPGLIQESRSILKRALRPYVGRLTFFSRKTLGALRVLPRVLLISKRLRVLQKRIPLLHALLWSVDGGEGTLVVPPLPLWQLSEKISHTPGPIEYDLVEDCGFIFFSAAFPMKGPVVAAFAHTAENICRDHRIEPIVALYNMSETTMMMTLYILFDKKQETAERDAHACYAHLGESAAKVGGYIHRIPVDKMGDVTNPSLPYWRIARTIKNALDPEGIIAPGRYIPE